MKDGDGVSVRRHTALQVVSRVLGVTENDTLTDGQKTIDLRKNLELMLEALAVHVELLDSVKT